MTAAMDNAATSTIRVPMTQFSHKPHWWSRKQTDWKKTGRFRIAHDEPERPNPDFERYGLGDM